MRTRSEVQTDILALGVRKDELLDELDQVRMAEDPATRYQSDLQEAMEKDANRRYGEVGYTPRADQRFFVDERRYEHRGYRRRYPQVEYPDRVRDAYAQTVGGGDSFRRRLDIWVSTQRTPVQDFTVQVALADEKIARLHDDLEHLKAQIKVAEREKALQQQMLEIAIKAEEAIKATLPPKPPYDDSGR